MNLIALKPDQFHEPKEGGHKAKHIFVAIHVPLQSFHDSEIWAGSGGTLSKQILWLSETSLRLGDRKKWVLVLVLQMHLRVKTTTKFPRILNSFESTEG